MDRVPAHLTPIRPKIWKHSRAWVPVVVAISIAFYGWLATSGRWVFPRAGSEKNLINQQVEAFSAGQLSLLTKPSTYFLALKDPYDPATNQGSRLLDASYYKGKYYTYFGLVPIVAWLWPYHFLTGHHAPLGLTLFIFASGALCFQAASLRSALRGLGMRSEFAAAAGVALVGSCSLVVPLLGQRDPFSLPVVAGIFFVSCGVWLLLKGLNPGRYSAGIQMACIVCFALAAGCRPNLLLLLPVPVVAFAWSESSRGTAVRAVIARIGVAAVPGAMVICLLCAYNVARFHAPFEFGFKYQLVGTEWQKLPPYALQNGPFDLFYYLIAPPRLSAWFPYFLEQAAPPFAPPLGHDPQGAVDRVVGWLVGYPVLMAGSVYALLRVRGLRQTSSAVFVLVVALALLFCLEAGPFQFFAGVALRYQAESSMGLALASGLGIGLLLSSDYRSRWTGMAIASFCVAWIWSAILGLMIALGTGSAIALENPGLYSRIARASDEIAYPVIRAAGWQPRIADIEVRLPKDKEGRLEPLWVYGEVPSADFLYIYYSSPSTVQVGFESMGRGGPVSDYVQCDYSARHHIELEFGAFLPPEGHPFYRENGLGEGQVCRHMLRVRLDGVYILDALVDFHDGKNHFEWGRSSTEHAFGDAFSGDFHVVLRPFTRADASGYSSEGIAHPKQISVRWPNSAGDHIEPVLVFGAKNGGQMVYAHFLGESRARMGILDSSGAKDEGPAFTVKPGELGTISVDLPAFRSLALDPVTYATTESSGLAVVTVDGLQRLSSGLGKLLSGPNSIVLGRNTMLIGGITAQFEGDIKEVRSSR